jgi:flagellar basal-body rod modification protein FlgD
MSDDFWSIISATSPISSSPTRSTSTGSSAATNDDGLGKDAFLKLLMTQMQNQDPMSPMDSTDFFAQLAQFSLLEQMFKMNDSLTQMQQQNQVMQGSAMIGRTVAWKDDAGETQTGVVDGIKVTSTSVLLNVGGEQISLSDVIEVTDTDDAG